MALLVRPSGAHQKPSSRIVRAAPTNRSAMAAKSASLVGVSRVIDQQHWPSDVLMGALVGSTIAHLAYLTHFDESGQPRRRMTSGDRAAVRLVPLPTGAAVVGQF